MPKSDTLTPLQAALVLQVSTRTVTRWADDGVLRVVERTPGGQRRFDRADIEALAAERLADAV
jgi:excisionase family DNA binding protein